MKQLTALEKPPWFYRCCSGAAFVKQDFTHCIYCRSCLIAPFLTVPKQLSIKPTLPKARLPVPQALQSGGSSSTRHECCGKREKLCAQTQPWDLPSVFPGLTRGSRISSAPYY